MNRIKNSLVAFGGLSLVIGLVMLFTPASTQGQDGTGGPPPRDVNVVNTPLPVTGTVNIGNLGDSPLAVRDVDNPARRPFHSVLPFTVPAGKRLVIEHYSARFLSDPGCRLSVDALRTSVNGASLLHFFTPTLTGSTTQRFSTVVSQQTRLYADPGTTVSRVAFLAVEGDQDCLPLQASEGVVSGYLVDVPEQQ